ncbi:MAG: hypothetical protein HQL79_03585 [Magnetococcales bacterium]|nr:hypothetical protein [Magnetococcales bacterium]
MEFIPLYYKEKLDIINPHGDVGVVTLWSPVTIVKKHLRAIDATLLQQDSRIAVLGTLYGDGLPEMLRNVLYNPHIRFLMLFGVDLATSRKGVLHFFQKGLEATTVLGTPVQRIIGTTQTMDNAIHPDMFRDDLTIVDLGAPNDSGADVRVREFFSRLPVPQSGDLERIAIPLKTFPLTRHPSEPRSHTIVARTPMAAWKEVIFRLYRFGFRVHLDQGKERIELQTLKVTIQEPYEESSEVLQEHGFSLEEFKNYQKKILDPHLPPDQNYSYGHRLHDHFKGDTLARAITLLKANPESRQVYVSLWDTSRDLLTATQGHPCLVSLFFRRFDQCLTLTAVFRTHNALRAWPENVYGLIAIQRHVCQHVQQEPGPITVFSHSISIDPKGNGLERARSLCAFRRGAMLASDDFVADPNGDFLISVDPETQLIVVDHRFAGHQLFRYTGQSSEELERQLVCDQAISDVGHALYLGRELAKAEAQLKKLKRHRE